MSAALAAGLIIGLLGPPASAAISLNYQGSFKAGVTGVYDGDLVYDPSLDGGNGGLVLSGDHSKQMFQLSIPALVQPTSFTGASLSELNVATRTSSASSFSFWGLDYAADGSVYWASVDGGNNQGFIVGTINDDGTNKATLVTKNYQQMGAHAALVDTSYFAGYDKVVVGTAAGITGAADLRMVAVNTSTGATQTIMQYTTASNRTDALAGDTPLAAVLLPDGGQDSLAVLVESAKTDTPASANRILLYHLSDIADNIVPGHNLSDAQPYQTIDLQGTVFSGNANYPHGVFGLAFDSANNMLYTAESNYSEPDIISAYSVVPEPATLALLGLAGLSLIPRRR